MSNVCVSVPPAPSDAVTVTWTEGGGLCGGVHAISPLAASMVMPWRRGRERIGDRVSVRVGRVHLIAVRQLLACRGDGGGVDARRMIGGRDRHGKRLRRSTASVVSHFHADGIGRRLVRARDPVDAAGGADGHARRRLQQRVGQRIAVGVSCGDVVPISRRLFSGGRRRGTDRRWSIGRHDNRERLGREGARRHRRLSP